MSGEPTLHVALLHPEIGPNAGNAGRLCLGIGARLHLVHPLGFSTSDKAVRRAGLDYWKHVDVVEHDDLAAFDRWAEGRRMHALSAFGARSYTGVTYTPGDVLLFGCESTGLPPECIERLDGGLRIPVLPAVRGLNLSNAIAVVAYRALQDIAPQRFS